MKNSRIAIVGATLLLAAFAGTATASDGLSREVGCRVDAVAAYLANHPTPAGDACGG